MKPVVAVRFCPGRGWLAWLVRVVTRGRFSHVDLVLAAKPYTCVTALPGAGVTVYYPRPEPGEDVVVLPRPIEPAHWLPELGKPYDYGGVLRLVGPYPSRAARDDRAWFCTELAATVLERAYGWQFRGVLTPDALHRWLGDARRQEKAG